MSWAKSTSQMEIPLQEILLRSVNCHAPCQFKYIVGGLIRHVEKVHCYRFMTGHVVSTDGDSLRPSQALGRKFTDGDSLRPSQPWVGNS